jgi:PEGA domain
LGGVPVRKIGELPAYEVHEGRPPSGEFLTRPVREAPAPPQPTDDDAPTWQLERPPLRRVQESRQETARLWSPLAKAPRPKSLFTRSSSIPPLPAMRETHTETAITTLHVVKPLPPLAFPLTRPGIAPPPSAPSVAPAQPFAANSYVTDPFTIEATNELELVDAEELSTGDFAEPQGWLDRARRRVGSPADAFVTLLTRLRFATRHAQDRIAQLRSELGLLALRTHGIVVHRTRGRFGAILVATAPVLLLSAAAGIWFMHRAPVAKQEALQAPAAVDEGPSDAEIARILRSRTGFTVTTEPAGAPIFVDGHPTGRVTPERVSGFAPGLHSIELKLAGHYETNLAAVLEEGSTLVLPPVILRALPNEHEQPAEQ